MIDVHVSIDDMAGRFQVSSVGHSPDPAVCAAVSAIVQTCALGLEATAERHPDHIRLTVEGH